MGVACLEFRGENFRGWLKNREIRESFLPRKFPAIRYVTSHASAKLKMLRSKEVPIWTLSPIQLILRMWFVAVLRGKAAGGKVPPPPNETLHGLIYSHLTIACKVVSRWVMLYHRRWNLGGAWPPTFLRLTHPLLPSAKQKNYEFVNFTCLQ